MHSLTSIVWAVFYLSKLMSPDAVRVIPVCLQGFHIITAYALIGILSVLSLKGWDEYCVSSELKISLCIS